MIRTRLLNSENKSEMNPRKISGRRLKMLVDSLKQFGDLSGFVFNKRSNKLVGGHQRLSAFDDSAKVTITHALKKPDAVGTVAYGFVEMNGTRYSYREVDWNQNRERAANIAANKHGGEFDDALVTQIIRELDVNAPESASIGFDADELAKILGNSSKQLTNNEVLLDQAVQLKPAMEYVIIACDSQEQFDDLRERLKLRTVRRGGYKKGSEWDDVGVERVMKYDRFVKLLPK
jgi:hypothetical protein